jgi:hypothetical protein
VGADHGQDREREGDVGGGRDRPPGNGDRARPRGEPDVDQSRRDHPTDRRSDRKRGAPGFTQVTCDELALEIEAREEEDREQPIGRPRRQGEVEVQGRRTEGQPPEGDVARAPRRVGPAQRHDGRTDQQEPADGLDAYEVTDSSGPRPKSRRTGDDGTRPPDDRCDSTGFPAHLAAT